MIKQCWIEDEEAYFIDLPNETRSEQWAKQFASLIKASSVYLFQGGLGAGKTTLIRAILRTLGVTGRIKSPSFSLVETYELPDLHLHHFDLYRIQEEDALDYIGFSDYFTENTICFLEWPEHAPKNIAQLAVDINFTLTIKGCGRLLMGIACSTAGQGILSSMGRP